MFTLLCIACNKLKLLTSAFDEKVEDSQEQITRLQEFVENLDPNEFENRPEWDENDEYYVEEPIIDPETILREGREALKRGQELLRNKEDFGAIEPHLDVKLTLGSGEKVTQYAETAMTSTPTLTDLSSIEPNKETKEEILRQRIMENIDDALELAKHVDEIEFVIHEGDFGTDEEEMIALADEEEFDEWEDEFSGEEGSEEEEEEEHQPASDVDVSDVDDSDLMKRLEAKYGKLDM